MRGIVALSLILPISVLFLETACGNIVINEVELNPAGDENGFKAPASSWVELYNDDVDMDISGWTLNTSEGRSITLPEDAIIKSFDYYIIMPGPQWQGYAEMLLLIDENGLEIDITPSLKDTEDDELAWTREPDGRDTDSEADWKFLPSSAGF